MFTTVVNQSLDCLSDLCFDEFAKALAEFQVINLRCRRTQHYFLICRINIPQSQESWDAHARRLFASFDEAGRALNGGQLRVLAHPPEPFPYLIVIGNGFLTKESVSRMLSRDASHLNPAVVDLMVQEVYLPAGERIVARQSRHLLISA